jgi:hypothetical protein
MTMTGQKQKYSEKNLSQGHFSNICPTLEPETEWRLHNERPVTNCLNHGMAFISRGKGFSL